MDLAGVLYCGKHLTNSVAYIILSVIFNLLQTNDASNTLKKIATIKNKLLRRKVPSKRPIIRHLGFPPAYTPPPSYQEAAGDLDLQSLHSDHGSFIPIAPPAYTEKPNNLHPEEKNKQRTLSVWNH